MSNIHNNNTEGNLAECACCGGHDHGHSHDAAHEHGHPHDVAHGHSGDACCDAHGNSHDHGHSHSAAHTHDHGHSCACCSGESEEPFFTPLNIVGIVLFAAGFFVEHFASLPWVSLVLLLASYIIIGRPVFAMAFGNIRRGSVFDENFLMCAASVGAFVIGEHSEAAAVMLFYMVGEYFQGKAVSHSRTSIRALMDIRPDEAWVCEDGAEAVKVRAEGVAVGAVIEIRPGGRVPLDAEVVSGSGNIDMMALTGETVPVDVGVGDTLLAGAVNGGSLLRARVTKPFAESTASKIIEMAQNASERKAPAENFITRFARVYTPIVVTVAAGLAVLPPLFGAGAWSDWIMRGLVFLVVSCPCALVISIPVSYFGGIGGASSRGILVKGGNYLDTLGRIGTVVFDKTGTLTKGEFKVAGIISYNGFAEDEALGYAAAAESASTHPIAVSIVGEHRARQGGDSVIGSSSAEDIVESAGYGVAATVGGKRVLCGNAKSMADNGIDCAEADSADHSNSHPSLNSDPTGTAVHVAVGGEYAGRIIVADEVKRDSAEAIAGLKRRGVKRVAMLSGDAPHVAQAVGDSLGIDEVYAGLLPNEKVEMLERIIGSRASGEKGGAVAAVGDGINDAPMLARADVGIAMGGLGSDAAVEAADVVIMNDTPSSMLGAVDVARKTRTVVVQNIVLALGVKGAVLILAALGVANMWEAIFADVGVALLAVLNAMRAGR